MVKIVLLGKNSRCISAIVAELKGSGLVVGVDFDFVYKPGRWDWEFNQDIPRQTEFTFTDSKNATTFALKWL